MSINRSDFTVHRIIDNRHFLFNTLYGTIDEIDNDIFEKYSLSGIIDNESKGYLINRKHLQRTSNPQYDEYLSLYEDYKKVRNRPIQFYIPLTLDCNLSCTYCFQKGHNRYGDLSENSLQNIVSAIKNIILLHNDLSSEIIVYGGEPLLAKNMHLIDKLFSVCKELNIKLRIITNGINIPLFIKKLTNFSSIISNIIITIDGNKKQHDTTRVFQNGKGTYNKIIQNVELLNENKVPYTIRINATDLIIEDICNLSLDLKENTILYRVKHTKYSNNVPYKKILSLLLDNKLKVEQIGLNPIKYFYYLINDEYNSYPLFRYCDSEFIYLFSLDGKNIYHCNEKEEKCLFAGTYSSKYNLVNLQQFNSVYTPEKCRKCKMLPICGGGCPLQRDLADTCPFYEDIMGMIDLYINRLIS